MRSSVWTIISKYQTTNILQLIKNMQHMQNTIIIALAWEVHLLWKNSVSKVEYFVFYVLIYFNTFFSKNTPQSPNRKANFDSVIKEYISRQSVRRLSFVT